MKVCFILITNGWGGGENVVHQLISCLLTRNVEVSIILNHEMRGYFEDMDMKIFDLGNLFDSKNLFKMILKPQNSLKSSESKPIKLINMLLMYIYFYRARDKIENFLRTNEINLIHSNLEYSDMLGYILQKSKCNIKWVSTIHGPWFSLFYDKSNFSSISNRIFTGFLRKAFKSMDNVVFVSKYLYEQSQIIFKSEIDGKGKIIHNGLDIKSMTTIDKETFEFNAEGTFKILFPGGPKLKKGGDILIKAVKNVLPLIPDLKLYIALEVPKNHLIRKLVRKCGMENNVEFLGFLKPEKYKVVLNSVDILAMPSRMEPFGMVYLEAMAAGVPVIASNIGGATEIINNLQNGILVSPKPEDVSEAILKLYNDENLRKEISENNLRDVNEFDWETIVEHYFDLYNNLILG